MGIQVSGHNHLQARLAELHGFCAHLLQNSQTLGMV
jgi:hypothetical protein